MKTEREAFKAWVLKHPDNLNITSYEESIMFDAWQASAQREGYKLVPVELTNDQAVKISDDPEFFETYQTILDNSDTSEDSVSVLLRVAHKAMIGASE